MISTGEKSVVNKHCSDIDTKFAVGITESQEKLPTFYWLPKLHKRPYKARFIYFWSIKNSTEILNKLKTKGFQASNISTYDFSTLYTTLPHNLIRIQLVDSIENTFRREEVLHLACNEEHAFFASEEHKKK